MLAQLRAVRADQSVERRLLRFSSPNLLIVDDLGLRPLIGDEPVDLYEVIRQRTEHGSTACPGRSTRPAPWPPRSPVPPEWLRRRTPDVGSETS